MTMSSARDSKSQFARGKGGLCHQSCLRLEVVYQSHFSKLASQAAYHRTSAGDFALWFSFAFFGQLNLPNRCQHLPFGAAATLYHSPGSARCCSLCPSSVHGKRNNPSAFVWSLPSRWAIDGEFKLGQPFQPAWILAHWSLKLLSHFTARWSDRTVKLFPSSKCPIPHTIARELFRRSTAVPFRDGQRRAA